METPVVANLGFPPMVTQSHPWLVMCGGKQGEVQTFFSLTEGRYYTRNIPELRNKKIFSFCMEWLVLADYDNQECSLLNVITMEKVGLPKFSNVHYCFCCKLTSPPEDPRCHVVFIDTMPLSVLTCQPGDDKFIKRKMKLPEEDEVSLETAICFNEFIYGIMPPSLLIRANINDPTLEFKILFNAESFEKEPDFPAYCYLTESCGDLLVVVKTCLPKKAYAFKVFQADFSISKWVLLKNIGDRAIFLEPLSRQVLSFSASQHGIEGNCIYYTHENDRTLYMFNLEDHSLTMTIPCPTLNPANLIPHWVRITPSKVPCDRIGQC